MRALRRLIEFRDHCSCGHVRIVGFVRVGGSALELRCRQPPVADSTVNQGLGSYDRLVRGKETLVRLYLSMPQCARFDASIQITGGTLRATGAARRFARRDRRHAHARQRLPDCRDLRTARVERRSGRHQVRRPRLGARSAGTTASYTASFRADLTFQYKTSNSAAPIAETKTSTTSATQDGREEDERAAGPRCPDGQRR